MKVVKRRRKKPEPEPLPTPSSLYGAPPAPEPPQSLYGAPPLPVAEPPQSLYGAPETAPDYDAGECPAVNPLTDAECDGAVSNCWSPGQLDTDCPNFGLCCFDGCANTCVDDNTIFIPVCYELCEYDSVEKCCDFPAKDCNLVTHEICIEEDTWECNDIEVETCSFFVDTITELATDQHCNVKCVDQPCKKIPMYWCKTCKNDQPNHVCRP